MLQSADQMRIRASLYSARRICGYRSIGGAIKPVKSFAIFHFRWYISDTHMQTERTVLFQDLDSTGRTRKLGLRLMAPAACCASWMDALPALPVRSQEWAHWTAKSAPAEGRLLPHTKHKAKDKGSRKSFTRLAALRMCDRLRQLQALMHAARLWPGFSGDVALAKRGRARVWRTAVPRASGHGAGCCGCRCPYCPL